MDKHDELAMKIARETHIIGHTFAPVSDDVINFARRLRAEWEKEQGPNGCSKCHGTGEAEVYVYEGGPYGRFEFEICPACNGSGVQPTESRAEIEAKALEEAANEIGHCWRCKADDTLNGMAADRRVISHVTPQSTPQ